MAPPFFYNDSSFTYQNKPFRIISGAIHYFRVVPEYWEDRLLKLKACGFNTVETYVCWNLHEPKPGKFDFSGILDIKRFIEIAGEVGLHVIVRPGPYICSEWEFGGLPAWLLADSDMKVRCMYKPYINAVERFYKELFKYLIPLQCTKGGPIIAMQIENEYGAYGNDKEYLKHIEKVMIENGADVLFFTSDQANERMLQSGCLPQILKTGNFGSDAATKLPLIRQVQPKGPLMCMEFWNGWFDHWGENHHTRTAEDAAKSLDEILSMGGSVNSYMFHGGTNFGFLNGANCGDAYRPTISSYDSDAPLSEAGDITPKYELFKQVVSKYSKIDPVKLLPPVPKKKYGQFELKEQALLFDSLHLLSKPVERVTPEPMEKLGQNFGFILYRTTLKGPRPTSTLHIQDVHDRAQVFLNGKFLGIIEREKWDCSQGKISFSIPPEGAVLDILVENMGRANYGSHMLDRKGITEGVLLDGQFQFHWSIFCLPLEDLSKLEFKKDGITKGPMFCRAKINIDEPGDTFLTLPNWTKGICFINGFNLGRYWKRGPQRSLYIPAPLLRKGSNELIVFELEQTSDHVVEFNDKPSLDHFLSR